MTLHDLQRRLTGFDIRAEAREAIIETSEAIKTLNQGQLFLGQKSDGTYLPDYSVRSVDVFGKRPGPIMLHDTGAFWEGIKVDVHSETFDITDTDSKTPMLIKKYGEKILGLTKESKSDEYVPLYFFPALREKIERKLGIKFS